MAKYFYLSIFIFCISCHPLVRKYEMLTSDNIKGNLYYEKLKILKPILREESSNTVIVVSWNKSMLSNEKPKLTALIYNYQTKEKKIFETSEKGELETISSNNLSDRSYKEYLHILENYLKGNVEYLLSLKDSFSSSEVNSPYYVYDFLKNKKIKINSFIFDKNGNIIQ
ncbi:hypothetical protein ACVVIH_12265 [Chryseobacterium arthrosphaerae]|uniref:hypothetical protein n=1 Tax=Chryseobacterium arthrosphaerae TaxID=651561 RepID=UPI003D32C250